jgi:hypothetical protein
MIWLYAAGFKMGNGLKFERTGILILDSEPKGAQIFLNNKLQVNILRKYFTRDPGILATPIKIKNLRPREYDVRLEKEGYWSWEKKLEIKGGESTFAEDVVLFKNDLPQLIQSGKFKRLILSPNERNLVALGENEIIITNIETNKNELFPIASSSLEEIKGRRPLWNVSGDGLLLGNILVLLDKHRVRDLTAVLGPNAKNIAWHQNENNKIVYRVTNTVFVYNLTNQTNSILLSGVSDNGFRLKQNNLFVLTKESENLRLSAWDLREKKYITHLPVPNSSYTFFDDQDGILNLYDEKIKLLYLVDPLSPVKPLRDTIANITQANWINDRLLLYSNEFEIWLYRADTFSNVLLTRISSEIDSLLWHPTDNYIIYSTANNINFLELDDRDRYNITRLSELESIGSPILTRNGKKLYFYARIGNQEGIFEQYIQ